MQRAVFYQAMERVFIPSGAWVDKFPNPALRQKLTVVDDEESTQMDSGLLAAFQMYWGGTQVKTCSDLEMNFEIGTSWVVLHKSATVATLPVPAGTNLPGKTTADH